MIENGLHQDQSGRMMSGLDFEKLTQNSSDKHKADMSSQKFHGGLRSLQSIVCIAFKDQSII